MDALNIIALTIFVIYLISKLSNKDKKNNYTKKQDIALNSFKLQEDIIRQLIKMGIEDGLILENTNIKAMTSMELWGCQPGTIYGAIITYKNWDRSNRDEETIIKEIILLDNDLDINNIRGDYNLINYIKLRLRTEYPSNGHRWTDRYIKRCIDYTYNELKKIEKK
jgi:hypothetical protein